MRRRNLLRGWRQRRNGRRLLVRHLGQGTFQSVGQHLVHRIDEVQLHYVAQVLGYIRQVLLIVSRKDDLEDARPVCCQQLLFQAADRQHFAAQRDLAGHGDVAAHGNVAERTGYGCRHGDARRRTILRYRPLRNMYVDVEIAIEVTRQTQPMCARAHVRHGSLRRLLHYVAEFAGEGELAFAVNRSNLGSENRAADFRPRQACDQADFAALVDLAVAELHHAQVVVDIFGRERHGILVAFLHHLAGDFAADVADLALQVANAGFARVAADNGRQCLVSEDDVLFRQAGLLALLADQVLLGNLDFFRLSVAV